MFTMDDILNAKFGVNGNKVDACFKKTVKIKEFETEVIEVRSSVELPDNATGVERLMTLTLLQAQLEYMAYSNLAFKSIITENELDKRKKQLMADVDAAAIKYEKLTGQNPYTKYLDDKVETSGNVGEVVKDKSVSQDEPNITNSKVDSVVPMELGLDTNPISEIPVHTQELKDETVVTEKVVQPVQEEKIVTPVVEAQSPVNMQTTIAESTPVVEQKEAQVVEKVQQSVPVTENAQNSTPVQSTARTVQDWFNIMVSNFTPDQKAVFNTWNQQQQQVYFQQYLDFIRQKEQEKNFGNYMNQPV